MKINRSRCAKAIAVFACLSSALSAQATLDLRPENYVQYGDAIVYSLPAVALKYQSQHGGGVGLGNPFYVDSTPGAIRDTTVVTTGLGGVKVVTNAPGMDIAMLTPHGNGRNFFSGVWHSTLDALSGYLDGKQALFLFNQNQRTNGAATNQDLGVWAQIRLTGTGKPDLYFDLSNGGARYALPGAGGGCAEWKSSKLYLSQKRAARWQRSCDRLCDARWRGLS